MKLVASKSSSSGRDRGGDDTSPRTFFCMVLVFESIFENPIKSDRKTKVTLKANRNKRITL